MADLIAFNATTDLSNLLFTPLICGFTFVCMIALFGWAIGWCFNLLSKAF